MTHGTTKAGAMSRSRQWEDGSHHHVFADPPDPRRDVLWFGYGCQTGEGQLGSLTLTNGEAVVTLGQEAPYKLEEPPVLAAGFIIKDAVYSLGASQQDRLVGSRGCGPRE
jgi:hypothetical protein